MTSPETDGGSRLAREAAGIGTWEWDLANGTVAWSPEMFRTLGIDPGRADLFEAWRDVVHPEDREAAVAAARAHASRPGDFVSEFRILHPDDRVRWILSKGRCIAGEGGQPVRLAGVNIDVTERRLGEEALREGERRLRATYDQAPVGIAETDAEGRFLRVNDKLCEITGYERDEMLATNLATITAPADSPDAIAHYRAQWRGELGPRTAEKRYVHKSGRTAWVAVSSSIVRDEAGNPLYGVRVVRDITLHKHAEAALAERTRSLEILNRLGALLAAELDVGRVVQAVTDAGVELTGARFGAFFHNLVNDAGESYTLYTLSGAERSDFERFPLPRATAVFGPTFRGEGPVRSDDIVADPRYGLAEPYRGMPEGHLPVRSYLAVPVIARAGEVLGGLFFGHPEPGVFTAAAERMALGLAGQAASAIDNARLFQAAERAQQELETRVAERTRELQEAIATLHEEVLERELAEEALRQAQKMEAVGQLTGGIAHDFNNLLAGIIGSLELLGKRIAAGRTDGLERFTTAALNSAGRAAALTQRLLAFARRQPLDPRRLDVKRLLAGIEELLKGTVGPGIVLELDLPDGLWPTLCDPNQLENAVLNLAINARDAMQDGGRLTIEAANVSLDEASAREQGRDARPGDYVAVSVTDTGTGMAPEVMAKAFDPFFTTKPMGQGTGLGLSMLYGFIRQSGGFVRIRSNVGQGTTMQLFLPRWSGKEEEDGTDGTGEAARAEASHTVLVVDDEPTVRMLVTETLDELGYAALEAVDGPTGLRALESDARIDLLVTDVGLPGLNGRQLAEAARATRPELKVLFITGYAHHAALGSGDALSAGMELLTKPFPLDVLAAKIRAMVEGG